MKEFRQISKGELRNLCIKKNWYTCGNNEQYNNLLNIADKGNITTSDIEVIAIDIKNHSNTNYDITAICFEVARICYSLFEEEKEEEEEV